MRSLTFQIRFVRPRKNESREMGITRQIAPTSNPIHLRKIALSLSLSPASIRYIFPGILKNANINLTFNRFVVEGHMVQ